MSREAVAPLVDVFVSYKRDERPAVEYIVARLSELGLTVWFDASMTAGDSFSEEIDREARSAKTILVCWSPSARDSRWVRAEAMLGFEHDKLTAVYVSGPDGFSPPTPFNATHAEDLRAWLATPDAFNSSWMSVLRRIGKLCGRADIESWAGLGARPTLAALHAWFNAHPESPLRSTVEAMLNAPDAGGAIPPPRSYAQQRPAEPSESGRFADMSSWVRTQWATKRGRVVAVAGGLIAAVILAAMAWTSQPPQRASTAVFTFATATPALHGIAEGIATDIFAAMNSIGLEAISRSDTDEVSDSSRAQHALALGATFALDGSIVEDGDTIRVLVRLDDARARRTLWAGAFERDGAHSAELRLAVASMAVHLLQCAAEARRELRDLSQELTRVLLRSCELEATDGQSVLASLELSKQVAQAAPRSSFVLGRVAMGSAWAIESGEVPPGMQDQIREEALAAANAALRIDPSNGRAAAARAMVMRPSQSFADFERILLDDMRAAPDSPHLIGLYARLLRDSGRIQEAVVYYRRGLTKDPLDPNRTGLLAWSLATIGHDTEARDIIEAATARWPNDDGIWWARFRISLWFGTRADTLRILSENTHSHPSVIACWRIAADGLAATSVASRQRAAAAIRTCMSAEDPVSAIQVLAALGEVDAAFDVAETIFAPGGNSSFLGMFFVPSTRSLRRDARFMPLMQRADLIDFWRESDRWPDFCAEPDLPYDCRAEAARLAASAPASR